MNGSDLHFVAFNVPWPPNYGGVIDMYYRLREFARAGLRVDLHCFDYGRGRSEELESLCRRVHYYPRRTAVMSMLGTEPYIVASRANVELHNHLLADNRPIFFDGLHCCYYLDDPQLVDRRKVVRMHNVEWQYYANLAEVEHQFMREIYFQIETRRLKKYERILANADGVACISPADTAYYQALVGDKAIHVPAFHPFDRVDCSLGRGDYALYHGNLSVGENVQAASFLIHTFAGTGIPLIIAGMDPDYKLLELVEEHQGIRLISNPGEGEMERLIRDAHVHVLPTFQPTGIKLKLLRALFRGRFVLVNPAMVESAGLAPWCHVAEGEEAWHTALRDLMAREFEAADQEARRPLEQTFANPANAARIMRLLYAPHLQ